jgi:hypothetical protein
MNALPSNQLAWLALLLVGAHLSCQRAQPSVHKPEWVTRTRIEAGQARPAFDGNVELVVSITNTSPVPVVVEHMEREHRVQLEGDHGAASELHPFSVGVAKPLKLSPGERLTTSLLFRPLDGKPRTLRVYEDESNVDTAGFSR